MLPSLPFLLLSVLMVLMGTILIPASGLMTSDSSTASWAVERDRHVARSSLRASTRTSGEIGCLSVGDPEQVEGKPGEDEAKVKDKRAKSSRKVAPTSSGHLDPAR